MNFVHEILKRCGYTAYMLSRRIGCPTPVVDRWVGKVKAAKDPGGMQIKYLCRLRQIGSYSWLEFGKMLDEEFLKDDK